MIMVLHEGPWPESDSGWVGVDLSPNLCGLLLACPGLMFPTRAVMAAMYDVLS